jgi:hypothetical protein
METEDASRGSQTTDRVTGKVGPLLAMIVLYPMGVLVAWMIGKSKFDRQVRSKCTYFCTDAGTVAFVWAIVGALTLVLVGVATLIGRLSTRAERPARWLGWVCCGLWVGFVAWAFALRPT